MGHRHRPVQGQLELPLGAERVCLVTADVDSGRAERIQRFMFNMDGDVTPSLREFKE